MPLRRLIRRFRRSQLGGLAKDTGFVAVWQASAAVALLIQISLITHAFGLSEYGRLAIVMATGDLVSGLANLRVGVAATTHGARWLVRDSRVAAGVFQYGFAIDMATTVVGVVALTVIAVAIGGHLGGANSTGLVLVYSLSLFGPTFTRTGAVVLRLFDRFGLIAAYAWVFELGRVVLIVIAIEVFHSLMAVTMAIVIGFTAAGLANAYVAARVFRLEQGHSLLRWHVGDVDRAERRDMLKTMFHTLVISYRRVVQTQIPTLFLGVMAGTTQVGIYKVGTAAAATIGKLIDPAAAALLPRLSRLWSAGRLGELRRLIFRASAISAVAMGLGFLAVVAFKEPLLHFIGGPQGEAAGTVLLIAAAVQAMWGLVFWHSTLLFAAGRSGAASAISVAAVLVQLPAMLVLIPTLEATGAALSLLAGQLVVNVAMTWVALKTLREAQAAPAELRPAAASAV